MGQALQKLLNAWRQAVTQPFLGEWPDIHLASHSHAWEGYCVMN